MEDNEKYIINIDKNDVLEINPKETEKYYLKDNFLSYVRIPCNKIVSITETRRKNAYADPVTKVTIEDQLDYYSIPVKYRTEFVLNTDTKSFIKILLTMP